MLFEMGLQFGEPNFHRSKPGRGKRLHVLPPKEAAIVVASLMQGFMRSFYALISAILYNRLQ